MIIHTLRVHACSVGIAILIVLPRPAGAAWPTDPLVNVPLCTAASNQGGPVIVKDGAGGAIVAWADARGGGSDIYAQRVLASGVIGQIWSADGIAVCAENGGQHSPAIVTDADGGAIVAWQDGRDGDYDLFAQHVLPNGQLDPAWPVAGVAVCQSAGGQLYPPPAIITDGNGGAIILWEDLRGGVHPDIYAQHVMPGGTVDPAWPVDGAALCTATNDQLGPAAIEDGAGGAIVTWFDKRNGTDADIYAQRVLAGGTVDPAWPANGRALCTAVRDDLYPVIAADGAGGAIVAWMDERNAADTYAIYAQHLASNGEVDPAWPPDGLPLCGTLHNQHDPAIAADGAGGAVVAWQDYRGPGGEPDIYAQRVLAGGAVDPVWPADGRVVCAATGEQGTPAIIADGTGGAIVSWYDVRSAGSGYDIYAQRVATDGVVDAGWPVNGRALCTAGGDQRNPRIAEDAAGGAIVTWQDFRSGTNYDIYAQRVLANGQLGGDDTAVLLSLVSAEVSDQGVRLIWYSPDRSAPATVWRRTPDAEWLAIAAVHADGLDRIVYEDRDVEPGRRYGYRLGILGSEGEQFSGETWIDIPGAATLELCGTWPNPANRELTVSFSLPAAGPATIELVDVSGRTVAQHVVHASAGNQALQLQRGRSAAPGIYFVRLTQGAHAVTRKVCFVR